jgi:hypothetical protein
VSKYLSKGRFSSSADCAGANTYELRKFNRADWIYISPGAWAEMQEAGTAAFFLPTMITRLILVAICGLFGIGILIAPTISGLQTGRLVVAGVFLIAAWVIFRH